MKHNLISMFVGMREAFAIFSLVILFNQGLFLCMYIFPVGSVFDIEYHISSKDKLSRSYLQGHVVGRPDRKGSDTEDSFPRILFIKVVVL